MSTTQFPVWAAHNPFSPKATAWTSCPYCGGAGVFLTLKVCPCAHRGAFLRVYRKYVFLREHAYDMRPVRLKALDFIADFESAAKRALRNDGKALEAFHFRFRLAYPEIITRFLLKRHRRDLEADTLRAMELVGREITTMAPYPMYPGGRYARGAERAREARTS